MAETSILKTRRKKLEYAIIPNAFRSDNIQRNRQQGKRQVLDILKMKLKQAQYFVDMMTTRQTKD
jgi:hypothetical protein